MKDGYNTEEYFLGDTWFDDINLNLRVGNVLAIYTDTGPNGICGQSMSTTCPHESIHLFEDYELFREKTQDHKCDRNGKNAQWRYVQIGNHGVMRLVKHTREKSGQNLENGV